jgi:hypothetical protein
MPSVVEETSYEHIWIVRSKITYLKVHSYEKVLMATGSVEQATPAVDRQDAGPVFS